MDYNQFHELVMKHCLNADKYSNFLHPFAIDSELSLFGVSWNLYGRMGRNEWVSVEELKNDAEFDVIPEEEPEFKFIEEILAKYTNVFTDLIEISDDITNDIYAKIFRRHPENEYHENYGNYCVYGYKCFSLYELFRYLLDNDLLAKR